MNKVLLSLLTASTLVLSPLTSAHSDATGIVKERMDGFKAAKASMKTIKQALPGEDFAAIEAKASELQSWFTGLDSYFPKDSNDPPSEALDLIWEEYDQFSAIAADTVKAAAQLGEAANQRDLAGSIDAFSALGKSCKRCHDEYRE